MKYTENYNLKKPEAEDFYNVEDFNENMEVIDGKLKDLEDNKETPAGAQAKVDTHENKAAPHSGHETPAGAQAKADAAESAAKSYTDTHENKTSTHGMTATPTASRGAMYDSSKRLSSGAAPTSDNHVVRKVDLDNHVNSVSAHSATATPTASKIAMYDSSKRLSSGAAPTSDNHVIRKIDIDNVQVVNFNHGTAYVIRNFVHLYIGGGNGVEGELVTTLPPSIRPIINIFGVAFIIGPGTPFGSTSKLFFINTEGSVYCYNKSTEEDVYISAFYIKDQ